MHKGSKDLEIRPDSTTDCGVSCLERLKKSPSAETQSATVKGITCTSYFSAHFKNATFGVMERKFLCSGDVLDLADLTDKAM